MEKSSNKVRRSAKMPATLFMAVALFICGFSLGCEGPPSSLRPLYTAEEGRKPTQNDLIKGRWILATGAGLARETEETAKAEGDPPDFDAEITSPDKASPGDYRIELKPRSQTDELDYVRFVSH